jgi:hypothetical protein
MRGAIPQLPQYAFMAWRWVEAEGKIYLYIWTYLRIVVSFESVAWYLIKYSGNFIYVLLEHILGYITSAVETAASYTESQ